MPTEAMEKPFCVIGPCIGKYSNDRSWFTNLETGTEHAKKLIDRCNGTTELYVVQVIRVVRTPKNYEVVDIQPTPGFGAA